MTFHDFITLSYQFTYLIIFSIFAYKLRKVYDGKLSVQIFFFDELNGLNGKTEQKMILLLIGVVFAA